MVYIKFGIVFELFVYKIYGDSDGAFLCGTEILNSRLNEMDFSTMYGPILDEKIYMSKNARKAQWRDY